MIYAFALRRLSLVAALGGLLLSSVAVAQLEPQPGERELQKAALVPKLLEPPRLLEQVDPIFPEAASEQGLAGEVVMRLTIDAQGRVSSVEVQESTDPLFEAPAVAAAEQLVFSPAVLVMQPEEGPALTICEGEMEPVATGCAERFSAPVQIDYRMGFELLEAPEPPPAAPAPPAARFVGIIREAGSKRPLEGVEVHVEVMGEKEGFESGQLQALEAVTDAEGGFVIEAIPTGKHRVALALSGYEPATEEEYFAADEEVQAIYYLLRRSYSKFTTVVRERRPAKEVTKIALKREEVTKVPGTFGDPLRVLENLPGMARSGPIGGSLLVRGSSPGDSGVYFDGVEIPILYHFGGLTSVVNAEFLEEIHFYPGGFGARYGRATAGIVDIDSRDLELDSYRGSAELDLLDSGFFFAGPIDIGKLLGMAPAGAGPSPQKINFAAAARRSYIDALMPFFIDMLIPPSQAVITASPIYWDYQLKTEYRPHRDHRLSIMGFGSDDNLQVAARGADGGDFNADVDLAVHQNFHRLVGRYEARISPLVSNQLTASWGYTGFEAGGGMGDALAATFAVDAWSTRVRDEVAFTSIDEVELLLGVDADWSTYDLNIAAPIQGTANLYPRIIPNLDAETDYSEGSSTWMPAFYAQAKLGPFYGLTLIPGLRLDYYRFNEDQSRNTVEPRLAARWEVVPGTTVKAAFGIYEQMPDSVQLSPSFGNPDLDLPRAFHYVAGYEHRLTEKLNLNVELFFNDKDRQVVASNQADVTGGNVDIELYNNRGIARAYGAEVLLRHELSKHFYGWVAYTLSRSESRGADQGAIFNTSASGQEDSIPPWFNTSFDQTHILTLVGQVRPPVVDLPSLTFRLFDESAPTWLIDGWRVASKDWSIGVRFRLVSGNPTTPVIAGAHDLDVDSWESAAGVTNSSRMPTFNQLDVRVDRKVVLDNFVLNFYLDLLNAYNMTNVEGMMTDYRYREQAPLAGLPIMPVIGVQGEF